MADEERIRVAVRVRPRQKYDPLDATEGTVSGDPPSLEVGGKKYGFGSVFGDATTQREIYAACGAPALDAVLRGLDACVFAFGRTGAGKTYTMLGPAGGRPESGRAQRDEVGIVPRAAVDLFRRIARLTSDAEGAIGHAGCTGYRVRVSYVEVHREAIFDLLHPSGRAALSTAAIGAVGHGGLTEICVTSVEEVLDVIARGSAARQTAATNVHAHSSRSHASFTLTVEHRWKQVTPPEGPADGRTVHARTSRLAFVDLAGSESISESHSGRVDAAGVGTNLGLLHLQRCITARARKERAPFRDSALTKLLAPYLGGNAVVTMLACVGPAVPDDPHTATTLRYAQIVQTVGVAARPADVVDIVDPDPMLGDLDDPDSVMDRRTLWIETASFGDVFARCVGRHEDPLILYIHGSGSKNSSMWCNNVVEEFSALCSETELPSRFFQVAIDCPGYGRSAGERQSIRSYPVELVEQIVHALGRKSAAAIVGSSQGCASMFNAVVGRPRLAHCIAAVHPVAHEPERFAAIVQPTLLIFDVEDAGHPVSVGRRMKRVLPNVRYFEFAESKDPGWEMRNLAPQLFKLVCDHWKGISSKRGGCRVQRMPILARPAGGLRAWSNQHGDEWTPEMRHPSDDETDETVTPSQTNDAPWQCSFDASSSTVMYFNTKTGQIRHQPPAGFVPPPNLPRAAAGGERALPDLFTGENVVSEDEDDLAEQVAAERVRLQEQKASELAQTACSLCDLSLVDPIRLPQCRCALCGCCVEKSFFYFEQCPACGVAARLKDCGTDYEDTAELVKVCAESEARAADSGDKSFSNQRSLLTHLLALRKDHVRFILEYGNLTESLSKSKSLYTTYVSIKPVQSSKKIAKINKVAFNINPDYPRPTATVSQPNRGKNGFCFGYAMGRPFPCYMTIYFAGGQLLPIEIRYMVQKNAKFSRRVVVDLPQISEQSVGHRKNRVVVFNADPQPCNGWIYPAEDEKVVYVSQ